MHMHNFKIDDQIRVHQKVNQLDPVESLKSQNCFGVLSAFSMHNSLCILSQCLSQMSLLFL